MESDKYKVEILHYLNPHLIWVLVEKDGEESHFEQIGIYGILPLSVTIDFEGNVSTNRCEEWLPAVFVAMKNLLLEASEVWFSVTFLDRTISIFDNNLHKYGDLILKMKDGETVSMLHRLLQTGFVAEDVQHFHRNLKTKLDYINTVAVLNKIKQSLKLINKSTKDLDAILQKQTSVFHKTVELEEIIPLRNLCVNEQEVHTQMLLSKQINDLSACKDVDEKSAGRACRKTIPSNLNSGLMKKLNIIKAQSVTINGLPTTAERKNTNMKNDDKTTLSLNKSYEKADTDNEEAPVLPVKKKHNKNKGTKLKGNEANNYKKLVAFGPPGINPTQYRLKEVESDKLLAPVAKETHRIEDNVSSCYLDEHLENDELQTVKESSFNEKQDHSSSMNQNPSGRSSLELNESQKNSVQDCSQNVKEEKCTSTNSRKMSILRAKLSKMNESSSTADTDSAVRQGDDSDSESISALVAKLDLNTGNIKKEVKPMPEIVYSELQNNVNPFKNLDGSKSVFVEKLVSPTLMVHSKKGNRIQPTSDLRDIPFGTDIHVVLKNMCVKKPMRLQTVSWPVILRGHSLFLVSPSDSGKTLGYLPAVCRLVSDLRNSSESLSIARLTCIIVCATAKSVNHVEKLCKMLLHEAQIFACYTGMTDVTISTTILNGCDILICTPTMLVRLMRENLGLDLRSLNTFVIDDCERVAEVYQNELKFCLSKVKEMLKTRANKEVKVQYVVVSRIWTNFMSSLAKKAPDSVVCIGAFQECVLYSESDTSFQFLEKEKKIDAVLNFLDTIDKSKKTVIACRSDDEVHLIEKVLTSLKYVVYACDSTMNVHELYNIDLALEDYQEPLKGPILVCCDGNLTHLNITDAHYLIHFSLPELFSTFSRRFAVLIDNYSSVFNNQDSKIKIKIFLETDNVEQLPKILHFIKRCSDNVPAALDQISATVMREKDLLKAKAFVPLCSTFLKFGKCADIWNCKERHTIFQEFDKPFGWMPTEGIIAFKILHYHSPVYYSVRLLSCTTNSGTIKYSQTYSMISIKLGIYYSKEKNKRLHGIAEPGDVCAVSLQQNLFARCQVIKVLKYTSNKLPSLMLINLLDEERYEMAHDTSLYYLPDELRNIDSHVVKVILANIAPQDRDITYSKLAENQLKKITENNDELYMRGQISLVIGNCIFVETLDACQDLTSLNETVVKNNFRNELLDGHAVNNPNHISTLETLCKDLRLMQKKIQIEKIETSNPIKVLPKARWAHLESEGHAPVYYLYAKSPSLFFVQHVKFQNCLKNLLSDIKKYVLENPKPIDDVKEGDIVLAEFPDDASYERARIDSIINSNKVKCFFVDLGDWGIVSVDKILPISEKLITQLPFQAIECRLVGIRPVGEEWSEFSTNWLVDQFYDSGTNLKYLFAKRFTTEKAAFTGDVKYGVGLIDTYADDVYINKLMIDSNLAEENDEIEYLNTINLETIPKTSSDDSDSIIETELKEQKENNTADNKLTVLKTSQESKRPSDRISNAKKKDASTPDSSLSSNGVLEDNSTPAKYITPIKENAVTSPRSTSTPVYNNEVNNFYHSDSLTSNNNNQLSLVNQYAQNNERETHSSNNVFDASWENINLISQQSHYNQQAIMTLLGKNPIRSVPLVDNDDDIDDDRWDSSNPVQMLMVPNSGTSNITESLKSDVKIISKAIEAATKIDLTTKSSPEKQKPTDILDTSAEKLKQSAILSKDKKWDQWSILESNQTLLLYDDTSPAKMTISWCQDNSIVTVKVQVKVEKYDLVIKDKEIKFLTKVDDSDYGFKFELYGVVNVDKSTHSNKGTYIEIKLNKVMGKNWITLYKGAVNKITEYIDQSKKKAIVGTDKKSEDNLRKPKIVWRQNKNKVTMKILLITEKYDVCLNDKHIKFYALANDEEYGFEFELYGVVDSNKSSHSNKGQYILVSLQKVMPNNWLMLGKGYMKKWIVYDVDDIDVSSEDEQESTDDIANFRKSLNINNHESDSDEDFDDDVNFGYKK